MRDVQPFTQGPAVTIAKLTELVHLANRINHIVGDGIVKVTNTSQAITVGIDIEQLMARMPKSPGEITIIRATVHTTPGATTTVACKRATTDDFVYFDVECDVVGGTALDAALPLLTEGVVFSVYKDGDTWRSFFPFQTHDLCA